MVFIKFLINLIIKFIQFKFYYPVKNYDWLILYEKIRQSCDIFFNRIKAWLFNILKNHQIAELMNLKDPNKVEKKQETKVKVLDRVYDQARFEELRNIDKMFKERLEEAQKSMTYRQFKELRKVEKWNYKRLKRERKLLAKQRAREIRFYMKQINHLREFLTFSFQFFLFLGRIIRDIWGSIPKHYVLLYIWDKLVLLWQFIQTTKYYKILLYEINLRTSELIKYSLFNYCEIYVWFMPRKRLVRFLKEVRWLAFHFFRCSVITHYIIIPIVLNMPRWLYEFLIFIILLLWEIFGR